MVKRWIISDNHFSHANIITYTNRPFKDVEEMDNVMLENWNKTVGKNDLVYFLGDLTFDIKKIVPKLNGKKIFIKGNHDFRKKLNPYGVIFNEFYVPINNELVLMIHDPGNIPKKWEGWVIHGHVHNHFPEEFPKINRRLKRINVCVEYWNYTPIDFKEIENIIKGKLKEVKENE